MKKPIDTTQLVKDAANGATKAQAAAAQGVSVSTLRRRLADSGTNWSGKQAQLRPIDAPAKPPRK